MLVSIKKTPNIYFVNLSVTRKVREEKSDNRSFLDPLSTVIIISAVAMLQATAVSKLRWNYGTSGEWVSE